MIIYGPVSTKYTKEQTNDMRGFAQEYINNKEFRDLIDRALQDAEQKTSKTFRQRNDKENKRQEKYFLQKIRKILESFSNCVKKIFAKK